MLNLCFLAFVHSLCTFLIKFLFTDQKKRKKDLRLSDSKTFKEIEHNDFHSTVLFLGHFRVKLMLSNGIQQVRCWLLALTITLQRYGV
jgi:hypothetical protein